MLEMATVQIEKNVAREDIGSKAGDEGEHQEDRVSSGFWGGPG